MITFKTIRWRNFLSTGNQFIIVSFQKSPTNLIVGANGAGKSTILDALTFVLYNKPFRKIKKTQLINTVNDKACEVQIEFEANGKIYTIVRGMKPTLFEIYIDGKKQDQFANANDQQAYLEDSILRLNYKSFTQTTILGSATFVPFMQLSNTHRREIVEDVLDIKIFSSMAKILREKINKTSIEIKELAIKKQLIEEKIDMQKNFIKELEEQGKSNIKSNTSKIDTLMCEAEDYVKQNELLSDNVFDLTKEQKEVTGASEKLKKLNNIKGKITQKVSTITKEHKFFTENTVCPTCSQNIEEEFRVNRIADVQDKAKELNKGFKDLEETIKLESERERHFTQLSQEITKLNHDISQNNTRISLNQRQIRDLEEEVQTITKQFENRNTEHEKLAEFKENLQKTIDDLSDRRQEINHYDFAYSLLRDDGVKTKIIKKYLPFINQQVNRYLQLMDFYINFTLDEEFNETVKSPIHEDFSYASFSEGEKMRIDLALLFTWREVARVKNSVNTNLLIMDEVFDSSLDGFGTDEFLKIIRYIIKDANTFVISHKSELNDKFESVITFDKVKGFSRMISQKEYEQ